MKILIEESVLRKALETFTHCYAETDRRINERAKILVELRSALDAAEKVEPVNVDLATEVEAIDAWYRGDPNYEHDAYWMRDAAKRLVLKFPPLYTHPAPARDYKDEIDKITRLADAQAQTLHDTICSANRLSERLSTVTAERDELVAAMRVLDVALKVGAPEYEYADWCDIVSEALAKLGADKTGE